MSGKIGVRGSAVFGGGGSGPGPGFQAVGVFTAAAGDPGTLRRRGVAAGLDELRAKETKRGRTKR